jgi:predicted deacylase
LTGPLLALGSFLALLGWGWWERRCARLPDIVIDLHIDTTEFQAALDRVAKATCWRTRRLRHCAQALPWDWSVTRASTPAWPPSASPVRAIASLNDTPLNPVTLPPIAMSWRP